MAAAFAVASTPASAQAATQAPGRHLAATRAAGQPGATPAWLASLARPAATARPTGRHHAALPATYAVRRGDTLSVIAKRLYQSPDYWPVLYWANHRRIRYANQIQVGQVLAVPVKPRKIPGPPSALGPAPAPAPARGPPRPPRLRD